MDYLDEPFRGFRAFGRVSFSGIVIAQIQVENKPGFSKKSGL
jgi:hypothetical protein